MNLYFQNWNFFFKMSRAQAESVIKNIIREIAQECASKGQAVSETLVAFMVSSAEITGSNTTTSTLQYFCFKLCHFHQNASNSKHIVNIGKIVSVSSKIEMTFFCNLEYIISLPSNIYICNVVINISHFDRFLWTTRPFGIILQGWC